MLCRMKASKRHTGTPGDITPLKDLRGPLLALHKTLVESERIEYERTIGKINSPNHFLQLLTNDPWFAWLSPLSQLIVSIDEAMDPSDPPTASGIQALL